MRVLLAPMEGVLDSLVRELLTEVNDYDLCVTEFLRVVDMLLPVKSFFRLCPELHNQSRTSSGTLVRIQLLGQYPEWLAENAARAVELGSYGVDLNCGCPSKLVNGSGGGATLLKDPELIYRGAKAMREAVPAHLPVTVKVRLGWDSDARQFEIADAVQQAGATELVVHGRTKEDGYKAEQTFSNVSQKALQIFNGLNPILPQNKTVADNQVKFFVNTLKDFKFDVQDERIVVMDKDGKVLEDGHGNSRSFEDIVKEQASGLFEFKANNGGSGAGNGNGGQGGGSGNQRHACGRRR